MGNHYTRICYFSEVFGVLRAIEDFIHWLVLAWKSKVLFIDMACLHNKAAPQHYPKYGLEILIINGIADIRKVGYLNEENVISRHLSTSLLTPKK